MIILNNILRYKKTYYDTLVKKLKMKFILKFAINFKIKTVMLLVAKFGPKLQLAQDKNKYFIMVAIVNWSSNNKLLKFNEKLEKVRSNTPFSKSKVFNYAWYNEDLNVDKLNNFLTEHYAKYDYEYTVNNINQIISTIMSCITDWMITYTECTDNINSKYYNDKLIKLLKDDKYGNDSLDHLYDRELQTYVRNVLKDYINKNDINIIEMGNNLYIRYLTLHNFINNEDSELKAGNMRRVAYFMYNQKII